MRLARLGDPGAERPVLDVDGTSYDLGAVTTDIDGEFLAGDGVARARAALEGERSPSCRTPAACAWARRSPGRARSSASG